MSDILQRLQGKTELCNALGIWQEIEDTAFITNENFPVELDNDDCPGSALLVSRCLDWLAGHYVPLGIGPTLFPTLDGRWICKTAREYLGTRVLAALTAVLEVEEGK